MANWKENRMKLLTLLIPLAFVAGALSYAAHLLEYVHRALQIGG